MSSRLNGLSLVIAVAIVAGVFAWTDSQKADATPFQVAAGKVAVVDVEVITNEFLLAQGSLDALSENFARKRRALDTMRDKIRAMQEEAEIFPKDSARYLDAIEGIAIQQGQFKVKAESLEASQNREKAKLTAEVYEKARNEISDYAQENGLDMVFLRQGGKLTGMSMEDVSSNILIRSVIWHKNDLDITQVILDRMLK